MLFCKVIFKGNYLYYRLFVCFMEAVYVKVQYGTVRFMVGIDSITYLLIIIKLLVTPATIDWMQLKSRYITLYRFLIPWLFITLSLWNNSSINFIMICINMHRYICTVTESRVSFVSSENPLDHCVQISSPLLAWSPPHMLGWFQPGPYKNAAVVSKVIVAIMWSKVTVTAVWSECNRQMWTSA
jgi:hypothetical protein